MPARNPSQRPIHLQLLIALAVLALVLLNAQAPASAEPAEQPAPPATTALGIAFFVPAGTAVHTPDGLLSGPEGVSAYLTSLQADFPDAEFTTVRVQALHDLLIIDWQGTIDGDLVIPGRTLMVLENGVITDIWLLSLNTVAPVDGEPIAAPSPGTSLSSSYELPYEQGRPIET